MSKNKHSDHRRVTGLSGNEIYCLNSVGLSPGTICVGNSVFALGLVGGITSKLKTLAGGEIEGITSLIHEGREKSLSRMFEEAKQNGGLGVTGVSTELVIHNSNIEFLTIGSTIHRKAETEEEFSFSTSADAQELYCQIDAGFTPHKYVFGNVAYSIGVGGGIRTAFRSLARGEVPALTEMFDKTRHLALSRITEEARRCGANSVIGIETTITPLMGVHEMVMVGTASSHPGLNSYNDTPVTSDMTNQEMWNMIHIGYMPLSLVMGVSVYALGVAGGIQSALRSLARGEVTALTTLLYEARERSLDKIQQEANRWMADEVVGVKIHIYELGGGLIEFLAIGTAVRKMDGISTKREALPPQAIIIDRSTFFQGSGFAVALGQRGLASASATSLGPIKFIVTLLLIFAYIFSKIFLSTQH